MSTTNEVNPEEVQFYKNRSLFHCALDDLSSCIKGKRDFMKSSRNPETVRLITSASESASLKTILHPEFVSKYIQDTPIHSLDQLLEGYESLYQKCNELSAMENCTKLDNLLTAIFYDSFSKIRNYLREEKAKFPIGVYTHRPESEAYLLPMSQLIGALMKRTKLWVELLEYFEKNGYQGYTWPSISNVKEYFSEYVATFPPQITETIVKRKKVYLDETETEFETLDEEMEIRTEQLCKSFQRIEKIILDARNQRSAKMVPKPNSSGSSSSSYNGRERAQRDTDDSREPREPREPRRYPPREKPAADADGFYPAQTTIKKKKFSKKPLSKSTPQVN